MKNMLNARGLTANEGIAIDQATVVNATKKAVQEEAKAAFERPRWSGPRAGGTLEQRGHYRSSPRW